MYVQETIKYSFNQRLFLDVYQKKIIQKLANDPPYLLGNPCHSFSMKTKTLPLPLIFLQLHLVPVSECQNENLKPCMMASWFSYESAFTVRAIVVQFLLYGHWFSLHQFWNMYFEDRIADQRLPDCNVPNSNVVESLLRQNEFLALKRAKPFQLCTTLGTYFL